MGAEYCPYKLLFLAAIALPPLVGIGKDMNQAGYFNARLYLIASPTRGYHFLFPFQIVLSVYTYHPRIE
jgi:hypothetical protein